VPLIYDDGTLRAFWTLCGSDGNNAYLVVCPETNESIVIDAPLNPGELLEHARGTQVKAILITHRHHDHIEGIDDIVAATGAPVAAHEEDGPALPRPPDRLLRDGDLVTAGTIEVRVLHTPGHTPGSACYLAAGKLLFSGDTLYAQAPGETRGVEATQQLFKSLTERLLVLPDDTVLLPGHGNGSSIGAARALYRAQQAQYPDVLPPLP
jgi:hydroxyacylglutathione hydrolase